MSANRVYCYIVARLTRVNFFFCLLVFAGNEVMVGIEDKVTSVWILSGADLVRTCPSSELLFRLFFSSS